MICGVIKVKSNREFHNKDASEPIYQSYLSTIQDLLELEVKQFMIQCTLLDLTGQTKSEKYFIPILMFHFRILFKYLIYPFSFHWSLMPPVFQNVSFRAYY